ncbi:MAG TPA: hypothetical protein VK983_02805 [Candidatus Limnocylindrales bacterium]|nr:hypothetical protein [Candidatus Limnocylindrales bacterium]
MSEEVADYYRKIIKEACGHALAYAFEEIGAKDAYTVEEMRDSFDRYLDYQHFSEAGWRSEIVPNRTMCAAKQSGLVMEIGENRPASALKHEAVIESELHEGEIHVGRHVRGRMLGSGLAEFGLPGYVAFEEPFATVWASLYHGMPKPKGESYIMAIGLSAGYDGQERDFRDSFEIMWRLGLVNSYKADQPLDDQISKQKKTAYTTLVRIWRGMPTDQPGCIFPKDRAYHNTRCLPQGFD